MILPRSITRTRGKGSNRPLHCIYYYVFALLSTLEAFSLDPGMLCIVQLLVVWLAG